MTKINTPTDTTSPTTWATAPTKTLRVGAVEFAYRELGPSMGVPVVFLTHLAAVLDNWDPRVVDGIAAQHRVITFDNRGVGASTGSTPTTIEQMANDAVSSSAPSASIRSTLSRSLARSSRRARKSLPARRPAGVLVKKRNCLGSAFQAGVAYSSGIRA